MKTKQNSRKPRVESRKPESHRAPDGVVPQSALLAALIRLRDCPDVQQDETDPETDAARLQANAAIALAQAPSCPDVHRVPERAAELNSAESLGKFLEELLNAGGFCEHSFGALRAAHKIACETENNLAELLIRDTLHQARELADRIKAIQDAMPRFKNS